MKRFFLFVLSALVFGSCTSGPTTPTKTPAQGVIPSPGADGSASSAAVTTERLRLRRVDGPDIVTGLVTGQVIEVPLNVKLDIWAEIRRLETDRARVVVDWGNGNHDFSGCGACRVENTYTQPGRYPVSAQVVDLNAPSGTPPVLAVNVILVVPAPASCTTTTTTFVGGLNGTTTSSNFEITGISALPALDWSNVTGTAQAWDGVGANGALIGTTSYGNYEVQYSTGVPIVPATTYRLQLDMGYLAGLAGGASGYRLQLGTLNGLTFTGLGTPVTGVATYAGNLSGGTVSATGLLVVTSGAVVSGETLAVRWAQTSSLAGGTSDFFGIDNVKLSATRCVP